MTNGSGTRMISHQEILARWEGIKQQGGTIEEICVRMVEGESVREIAEGWGISPGVVMLWVMADDERYEKFRRACAAHAHMLEQEAVKIADEADVASLRVKVRMQVSERYRMKEVDSGQGELTVVVEGSSDQGDQADQDGQGGQDEA